MQSSLTVQCEQRKCHRPVHHMAVEKLGRDTFMVSRELARAAYLGFWWSGGYLLVAVCTFPSFSSQPRWPFGLYGFGGGLALIHTESVTNSSASVGTSGGVSSLFESKWIWFYGPEAMDPCQRVEGISYCICMNGLACSKEMDTWWDAIMPGWIANTVN